jgi:perosamine synthetase
MIFVNEPIIPAKAKKNVLECLDTTWISGIGKYVDLFEKEFAEFIGVKYAITTNSGTTALHLALLALDIKEGDEVILPASTIGSCFFAIWYCGATAVPVDVDPVTFNIDPKLIEEKITAKTKAIMVVHLYGYPAAMNEINKIAKKYNLKVIEDAAQAHGAEYKGKKAGALGNVGCFSFYANKIVTTGEGGIIVTNDKKLYERAKQLKGLNCHPKKRFVHLGIGYRYDMPNMSAAIGVSSLNDIVKSLKKKERMANFYSSRLKKIPGLVLPIESVNCKRVHWMYTVLVKEKEFGMSKDQLSEILLQKYKIQTRSFFYSPEVAFKAMGKFQGDSFPVAKMISEEGLYLPSGLGNKTDDFKFVVEAIEEVATKH